MNTANPFILTGYMGPDLFCDRESETSILKRNAENGVNTTLVSVRRMGKSGLIWHTMEKLSEEKSYVCIYADIYATQSLKDFTNKLGGAILSAFPEKKPAGKKFLILLKSLRPVFSYDALTGQPQVSFTFATQHQYEQSVETLLKFLDSQGSRVLLAIDEFQQILMYPEKNTEALLRSTLQTLKNVNLIFSGSSHHILAEMFSDGTRPFYASTQFLYLREIETEAYKHFIRKLFDRYKYNVQEDALDFILEFSRRHTFYTQCICNRVFASGLKQISRQDVMDACRHLLIEYEPLFFQYRSMLTSIQWNLLKGIAREGRVYQPTSKYFIEKHKIGTPANVQRAIESLLKKEMIYRSSDSVGNYFFVYDLFLSRWLESEA